MNELQKLSDAKQALVEARGFQEIKAIKDIAKAAISWAKAQGLSKEIIAEGHALERDAAIKLAISIEQGQKDGEVQRREDGGIPTSKIEVGMLGITHKESHVNKTIKNAGNAVDEIVEKLKDAGKEDSLNAVYSEIKKIEKETRFDKRKKEYDVRVEEKKESEFVIDIFNTTEKFRVVYADPAWSYNDKCEGGGVQSGGAGTHYDTMSVQQISDLPVNKIIEDDSVLFLWVTSPLLEVAFKVIKGWGFKYKTSFIWDKVKHNMGHYNSVRHELLLIATKGSCTPDNKKLYDSVQSIERNDNHSEKPIEFVNIIDDLYSYGNKIELFSRELKDNWHGWGNEL